jgi:hypothetical protein
MTTFDIAVRTDGYPNFDLDQSLDGAVYLMTFRWNERESKWYMTLADDTGDPIFAGVKVVADRVISFRTADARMPPGDITTIDTSGAGLDPGLDDLGNRVKLVYIGEAT